MNHSEVHLFEAREMSVLQAILLSLLCAVLIGGFLGYRYVQSHKAEFIADGKIAKSEGAAFGNGHDQKGCMEEGIRRAKGEVEFRKQIMLDLFVDACLRKAAPSAGFCTDVPEEDSVIDRVTWTQKRCAEHNDLNPRVCTRLFSAWMKACAARASATH